MLTLFTMPKPFVGHFHVIQRNAILSWKELRCVSNVLLLGDEPGTKEFSAEAGCVHLPTIRRNHCGTPLLDSLFDAVAKTAETEYVGYVNADIILLSDFTSALNELTSNIRTFLMVGQRRNLEIREPIHFDSGWERRLRTLGVMNGQLYSGIDYFVYPRLLWTDVPPFAIGRLHWDNWPLYAARLYRCPVVDTSAVVLALHQNHDYLPGALGGEESQYNKQLMGDALSFTTNEASHLLTERGLTVRCRSCVPLCVCNPELFQGAL